MNSDPWSYLTSTGQGYLVNHVFYTMSKTVIAFLSLYCVTYNHLITGPIILKSFNIYGYALCSTMELGKCDDVMYV